MSSEDFKIVNVTKKLFKELMRFGNILNKETKYIEVYDMKTEEIILKYALQFNGFYIAVMHGNEIAGICTGRAPRPPNNDYLFISTLAVISKYYGKGIGDMMLSYAIDFAKKKNFKRLELSVDVRNKYAIELYKRHKLKETGEAYMHMDISLENRIEFNKEIISESIKTSGSILNTW